MEKTEAREESFELNADLGNMFAMYWDNTSDSLNPTVIRQWLKNPMTYGKQLRAVSRMLYSQNGIYTNVIDYMTALPTLDYVLFGNGQTKVSKRFTRNKSKFNEALRIMKHKQIARDIILKAAIEGVYFGYFESTEQQELPRTLSDIDVGNIFQINEDESETNSVMNKFNCGVFSLPTDFCKIVGMKNSSYVIAFDLSYFDGFTGNGRALKLKRYPKEIRDRYREYNRGSNYTNRWAVLDNSKTIVIKIRANREEVTGRPLGLAGFVDMVFDEYFVDSKRQTLDDVNNAIIYQTFPEGEAKGQSALTQKQQKAQHENIKSALFQKGKGRNGISFFSIASGTKLEKMNVDTKLLDAKMEDELIKRISTDLGFAGAALNGEGGTYSSTESNIELVSAEVMSWLEQAADEFNKVINLNIIKDQTSYIQIYYLPTTIANRDKMVGYMKELYTLGKGSLQAWIAATGFNPDAYLALMDEELALDFDSKYPIHQTSFTSSGKDSDPTDKGGRPIEGNPTNENTLRAKTSQG